MCIFMWVFFCLFILFESGITAMRELHGRLANKALDLLGKTN